MINKLQQITNQRSNVKIDNCERQKRYKKFEDDFAPTSQEKFSQIFSTSDLLPHRAELRVPKITNYTYIHIRPIPA